MLLFLARTRTAFVLALLCLALLGSAHAQGTTPQTIQFLPISDRPVTSAPFYVVAVPSSELPVTFTVAGPASIDSRRLLTLTGVGSVTITATQPGNTQYAPASQQLTFQVTPAPTAITWQPSATLTYGSPLPASLLNATASAIPLTPGPADDAATITTQLNTSQIAPNAPVTYPQTSSVFRYEGSTMAASTQPLDAGGYIPVGAAPPLGIVYRVAFTCVCQQFEFVLQSRESSYRLWVDGAYQSLDSTGQVDDYPAPNFIRVQFPDKRARQIKLSLGGAPPFFGVITANGDTLSAPQVPIGDRIILFGDSWTGPTIAQALLPPAQDGLSGSGFAEYLGEYFNWDYWVSGEGGEGFTSVPPLSGLPYFGQRLLTDVCPFSPAGVVFMGGVNDGSSPEAEVQTSFNTAMTNLSTCLPGVPVYFYGPQVDLPSVEQAFTAVAPSYSSLHYYDMGTAGWGYGSALSSATGNVYLYFAGHPTPLGHNFIAEKLAMDLVAFNPSLLPTAYPLFSPAPAAGSFSYSAQAQALLPAGNNSITATFTPTDQVNYAPSSVSSTLTISRATSKVVFFSTGAGSSGPVTAQISPQIGGTPTGSLAISENGAPLATLQLSSAQATFDPSALTPGTHTLLFTYSGDSNFTGSSNTTTVTTTGTAAPNFTFTATPTQLSLAPGGKGIVSLAITPSGALNASLALTCTGLPSGSTCALSSGSAIRVAGLPLVAAVNLTLPSNTAALAPPPNSPRRRHLPAGTGVAIGSVLLGAGLLSARRRLPHARVPLALALAALGAVALSGCGSSSTKATTPLEMLYSVQLQLTNTAVPSMTQSTIITVAVAAQ